MPKRVLTDPNKLSTFDVARLLGVSRVTILNWIKQGVMPTPAMVGTKRTWTTAQIEKFKRDMKIQVSK
jgi:excisionase family DNA binding protein